jgi:hypothetical protein
MGQQLGLVPSGVGQAASWPSAVATNTVRPRLWLWLEQPRTAQLVSAAGHGAQRCGAGCLLAQWAELEAADNKAAGGWQVCGHAADPVVDVHSLVTRCEVAATCSSTRQAVQTGG